ncbi:hypothetical protein ACH6EH_07285 [Paenibacillus sp. JSM ZJ436]|uniref:hypothetical protein n=1 Tax=Paenibacillus sp. JSM ZJ436 TaxID=3376190 RepID=UPI0037B03107
MKRTRRILSTFISLVTIFAASYIGIWLMLVGGLANQSTDSINIFMSVLKVTFAGTIWYLIMLIGLGAARWLSDCK